MRTVPCPQCLRPTAKHSLAVCIRPCIGGSYRVKAAREPSSLGIQTATTLLRKHKHRAAPEYPGTALTQLTTSGRVVDLTVADQGGKAGIHILKRGDLHRIGMVAAVGIESDGGVRT